MEPSDPRSAVLKIFEEIRRAMLTNDAATLSRIVAEDYRGSDAGGRYHDRGQYLAAYGPGGVHLETFDVSDIQTTAWADTVLVSGVALIRGTYQYQSFEHSLRFLDAYRHRDGEWHLVASSATDIAQG